MSPRPRSIIAGVLTVGLVLFLFRNYYVGNGLLFEDANFLWSGSLLRAELVQLSHVWRPAASAGSTGAIANASQNYVLIQAMLSSFGIPLSTALVFPFLFCVGIFSFYFFARSLGAGALGAVAGAVFFIGNPWTADQMLAGHIAILAAVCLSPLVFLAFVRLYQGRRAYGFLLGALCATELALDPRISIFIFVTVVTAGVIAFVRIRTSDTRRAGAALAFALGAPLFAVVCNADWALLYALPGPNLVPFFYPPVEDLTVFSWFSDIWHSLVLSAYFIHFSWVSATVWGPFTFAPWYMAVVGVLVIPLLSAPKRRVSFFLGALGILLGIVLSMGTRALPTPPLYWLYTHVPLLSLLREPVKFGYLVVVGASVLAALCMNRLAPIWRAVLTALIFIAVLPIFFGNLKVTDGYGFQDFSSRPAYLHMLSFLEREHRRQDFRIAVFPPWLSEQSLAKGAFYTANPFVIQNEIPVIDAKIVNTANATTEQAWQAFYGIYSGTDVHPAATLGLFGVKYVVVPGGISLSEAAAFTPFSSADDALNAAIVARDPNFILVYVDGQNKIFENRLFQPIVRTAATPITYGAVPAILRQTLPANALGDAFTTGDRAQTLPPGGISLDTSNPGACIDRHGELRAWNAYYNVTKHNDWLGYWVASDWVVSAADTYRSRILQRFPLPFAYTESQSQISVPLNVPRGELYAEAAAVGSTALLQARVDGAKATTFRLTPDRLHWFDLGPVSAGTHTVVVTGSSAGIILRRILLDDGRCRAQDAIPGAGKNYFVPGPTRSVTVSVGRRVTAIHIKPLLGVGSADNPPGWNVPTPGGAVAAAWDNVPVTSGQPFPSFTGYHRLTFFSTAGTPLAGSWQTSDAVTKNLTLVGGSLPQRADVTVTGIPQDQKTIVALSVAGGVRGAIVIVSAPGSRALRLDISSLRTPFLLIPYIGPSYTISFITPGNAAGKLTFGADVRVAAPIGDLQFVRIPARAVVAGARQHRHQQAVIAAFAMNANGNLQPAGFPSLSVPVGSAQGLVLHVTGLRASEEGRAVITAFYDSWANSAPMNIGDVAVGAKPADYDVAVPSAPYAENVAFSIHPENALASLSLGAAMLSDSDPLDGGSIWRIPAMHARSGDPVAADDSQIERIPFRNPRGGYLVGGFTYDPRWTLDDKRHWEVNGFANAWQAGTSGTLSYNLQNAYRVLQIGGIILWFAALLAFALLQARRRPASA